MDYKKEYAQFASELKNARKERGWILPDLGEKIKISRAQIGKYERSDCCPDLDTFIKWAETLGYEVVITHKDL